MKRLVAGVLACVLAAAAPAAEPPRLVVVIVVDQLARYRATSSLPGGLGRLLREGKVFADAALEHAITETCPGHATILTGVHPGAAGIPGNKVFDGAMASSCVSDRVGPGETPAAAFARSGVLGASIPDDPRELRDVLRSPANLSAKGLGDLLGAGRRVFTVSAKDRTAIMLGGMRPSLALWLDPAVGFTTSRYYAQSSPSWLEAFNREHGLAPFVPERLPEAWRYAGNDPRALPDDTPYESAAFGRSSPHPVRGRTFGETYERLLRTPFVDALTLEVARTIAEQESLGTGPGQALLAISLSSNDYIGHAYGPDSQEAAESLRELDAQLGSFLRFLETRLDPRSMLVVLTADHGVAQIPEVSVQLGTSECRVPGGRVSAERWKELVAEAAQGACAIRVSPKLVGWDEAYSFKLDPGSWRTCRKDKPEALAAMATTLSRNPGVVHVWTSAEIERSGERDCVGYCRFYRNSYRRERSGDVFVQLDPTCQMTRADPRHESPYVTGHGTPYAYDRAIPLAFWGNGIPAGVVRGRARTVDIAPTIAKRLGLPVQREWNGRALPLD